MVAYHTQSHEMLSDAHARAFEAFGAIPKRGIWREVWERRWVDLEELNAWLVEACLKAWQEMKHPQWPELTVADVWQDERVRLMPCPTPFNGYIERQARR